jgi:hypothetical protein
MRQSQAYPRELGTAIVSAWLTTRVSQESSGYMVRLQCHAGLKANGDWVGIPFEYEWAEMLDRLPNVLNLYRKAEAERQSLELAQEKGQTNA